MNLIFVLFILGTVRGQSLNCNKNNLWKCRNTNQYFNCEYVCDGYDPPDCQDGSDENSKFCVKWNAHNSNTNDDISGIIDGRKIPTKTPVKCEKKGDKGDWLCPGTNHMINCEYVCDNYQPSDCPNGTDENKRFCDRWNQLPHITTKKRSTTTAT